MKNSKMVIAVILIVIVGAGAFFGGMKYQESKPRAGNFQQRNQGLPAARQGLRPVNGEIVSADDKSITVKLADGSSKIVILSDTTSINKSQAGAKSDLKTGEKVAVFGKENPDGSVTAQSVQLNPLSRGSL